MKNQASIKNWLLSDKHRYAILIAWAINCPCYFFAQNIVPNGSYEEKIFCPDNLNQSYYCKDWFEPYYCSADYYNMCNTNGTAGIPANGTGYQFAKEGVAYMGIILFSTFNGFYREFIETKLASPLLQGEKYCVKFYVSCSQYYIINYATNAIACLFTTDTFLLDSCNQEIFLTPQIENTQGIISDTLNWVLISGEFTASGGEQFLTIGNFRNDSNTTVQLIDSTAPNSYYAYYYIDDVSVTLCDDTVSVKEEEQSTQYELRVFPNPASGNVMVTATGGDEIIITDIAGRKIKTMQVTANKLTLDASEYENGIYFLTLYSNNRIVSARKLIIVK